MGDEEEDETTRSRFRLYRVRRTVLQILRDRGYMVASADLEMTEEQFREKFTDVPMREQLSILVQNRGDPTDLLFVFWTAELKGRQAIKRYVERMAEDDVKRAILVVQESMTAFAKTAMLEIMAAQGVTLEQFQEAELLVNITEHVLVPTHEVLTKEEKAGLLKKYRLKEAQLPRIQLTDPVARYYGLVRGQVVKIVRPSETAGKYVTYRLVV